MKQQINFRASDLTSRQLEALMQHWGTSQTETLTVVIDRIFRQEKRTMNNIRKAQIQAYDAQLALTYALNRVAMKAEEYSPVIAEWQNANRILNEMLIAGYAPRQWGMGLAATRETGDETPEQIEELDGIEY